MRHRSTLIIGLLLGATVACALPAQAQKRTVYRCVRDDTVSLSTAPEPGSRCTKKEIEDTAGKVPNLWGNLGRVQGTLYERMQDGNTKNFIFDVPTMLSYISEFMTLEPGDLVLTGTPAGVGLGQKPAPKFLRVGDEMRLGITGLGEQHLKCAHN